MSDKLLPLFATSVILSLTLACGGTAGGPGGGGGDNGAEAPVVTIESGPDELTNEREAELEFSCDREDCVIECRLGGDWEECESPVVYTDLADGEHNFEARGLIDELAGEPDLWSWTVDAVAPTVLIVSGPEAIVHQPDVTITLGCSKTACSYYCSLTGDAAGTIESAEPCVSPVRYQLDDDSYTFLVTARDPAGNESDPASLLWTIDTTVASCLTNEACDANELCRKVPGDCDGGGYCEPRPNNCPPVNEPVCGCDGSTYGNACEAARQGVNVDYEGECGEEPQTCTTNDDCSRSEYCARDAGLCEGEGVCRLKPESCPPVHDPVCGCDGETYANPCEAAMVGVVVDYEGECTPSDDCQDNNDCARSEYCRKDMGDCDGRGECMPRAEQCPPVYDPVCGCDGTTHSNACEAAAAGVSVDFEGACL